MSPIDVGREGRFEKIVEPSDTAERFGNPALEVLATPALCHWFESAAVMAIHQFLEAGEATVGTRLTIEHLKATPVGMRVVVEARITAAEGRRATFRIEAHDEREVIARGTHERYVIQLARFLEGVRAKKVRV
jgi:predicted thioesterase